MKIELGKRYVRRDGSITTPIVYSLYPFECSRGTYQEDGSFNEGGSCSDWNLIEEYVEQQPTKKSSK